MTNAAPKERASENAVFLYCSAVLSFRRNFIMTTAATKGASSAAVTFERRASPKKTPMRVILAGVFPSTGDLNIQSPAAMVQDEKSAARISFPSPLER